MALAPDENGHGEGSDTAVAESDFASAPAVSPPESGPLASDAATGPISSGQRRSPTRQVSPPPRRRRAPVLVAAAATTAWAAVLSYLPVAVLVALAGLAGGQRPSAATVLRVATAGWLLAHGIPVSAGGGTIALAPLAISALAAWRMVRAGLHTSRAIGHLRIRATLAVAGVYGLLGAFAATAATGEGVSVSVVRATLTMAGFGLVAAGCGTMIDRRAWARWWDPLPATVRDALRTGTVATLFVLAAGAAAAGISIAAAGGAAADMIATYHAGVGGQVGLVLLCLAYAPDLAAWAVAYLLGPGFAMGTDTLVSVGRVSLGPLPAVPSLAGLPGSAASGPGILVLGVPLLAALVAGALSMRRSVSWPASLGGAVLAGPVAGVLLGLTALASRGALGTGRLAQTGPVPWWVAAIGTAVVAVGAPLGVLAGRVLGTARRGVARPRRRT